ncbi:hypothetical protein LUZ60_005389 [Juncus effusus]|nr:hypothetical protein LUZ60_005389 [Juncus effusus]
MEAQALSFSSPPKPHSLVLTLRFSLFTKRPIKLQPLCKPSCAVAVKEAVQQSADTRQSPVSSSPVSSLSKLDKSGRFCHPRAARELALLITYAACIQGADPVQMLDKRVNAKRVPGYSFDKELLWNYNHMSFGEESIEVETEEEAQELTQQDEAQSAFEGEVLSAPPKLVYSNFVLRFTREILEAVGSGWNQRVHIINRIIPQNWKNEPASRIIELCILHISMAEIASQGTKHQIVINEAVDLAKRFCDGKAPRVINGCLRTFVKQRSGRIDGQNDVYTRKSRNQENEQIESEQET